MLNARLTKYLESNGIIVDEQNGFRRLRACIDHLFVLTTVIRNRKSRGLPTFCCFVDYQKAFDLLDRNCLLYKMQQVGIKGKMYKAIAAILSDSLSCVRLNGLYTPWFKVCSGVRQDVLLPTLFSLYINDLAQEIKSSNIGVPIDSDRLGILMYADDICLLAEPEQELQELLNIVAKWCEKWRMDVNKDKTNVVHFHQTNQNKSDFSFSCGDDALETVSSYKYLGCVF